MKNFKFQSGIISSLPNITGLEIARTQLYSTGFKQFSKYFSRKTDILDGLPFRTIKQVISKKETIKLRDVKKRIKANNLEGFILPMNMLNDVIKHHALPLSAQKQELIQNFCKLNCKPQNEAEIIHIEATDQNYLFAPNLANQIIANLHFNQSSRLTIGSANSILSEEQPFPSGEALLQITHLTHNALDLDLSTEISNETLKTKGIHKLKNKVSMYENCISIPYQLTQNRYSDHGYILHLKGKITPKIIHEIIGYQSSAFGGLVIATGSTKTYILSAQKSKFNILNSKPKFYQTTHNINCEENIGSFISDPNTSEFEPAVITIDQAGKLIALEGEITIALFPCLQSFYCI